MGQLVGLRWTLVVATAITVLCVQPAALRLLRTLHDLLGGAIERAAG